MHFALRCTENTDFIALIPLRNGHRLGETGEVSLVHHFVVSGYGWHLDNS